MSRKERPPVICDFEWASVCQYIVHVEMQAGLEKIAGNSVFSFALGRLGRERLLKQKVKTLSVLKANISKLETWVGSFEDGDFEDKEMAVLKGIYTDINSVIKIVQNHIDRLDAMKSDHNWQQLVYIPIEDLEAVNGGVPF